MIYCSHNPNWKLEWTYLERPSFLLLYIKPTSSSQYYTCQNPTTEFIRSRLPWHMSNYRFSQHNLIKKMSEVWVSVYEDVSKNLWICNNIMSLHKRAHTHTYTSHISTCESHERCRQNVFAVCNTFFVMYLSVVNVVVSRIYNKESKPQLTC